MIDRLSRRRQKPRDDGKEGKKEKEERRSLQFFRWLKGEGLCWLEEEEEEKKRSLPSFSETQTKKKTEVGREGEATRSRRRADRRIFFLQKYELTRVRNSKSVYLMFHHHISSMPKSGSE